MTAILRNGDTPSFRRAAWCGQPRGSSAQRECAPAAGVQPCVVRAKSIQYNTRPAIFNRQVNRYPENTEGAVNHDYLHVVGRPSFSNNPPLAFRVAVD
ncbi:hypothetical protein DIE14_19300 [Burkholderia sp. Bp9017]|nr:hypothetical protein DIE14_19300 [Burkholderia sp. Bp9017]RQZ32814.1 hypothetical protein DIE13_19210 [Burkholderia sp. Bp9016]